ncbi:MAG: PRC-barrel domain-containing protein [Lautropia sp.]
MKTSRSTPPVAVSTFAAVAFAAAAGLAIAQGTLSSPPQPPAAGASAQTPAMQQPGRKTIRAAEASHPLQAARLSKLDGVDLYDANNKKIGEIDDVTVDAKTGAIQQVIVETGGVAGVGAKKHVVPLSDLQLFSKAADDSIPVKATSRQPLAGLPAPQKLERDSPYVSAGRFIGTDVLDAEGKQIGEIEDVIVDLQSGQARVALMEFDKSWSPIDKLYAFQMSEFQPSKERNKLMLSVRKEALEGLPSISKSELDKADLSALVVK